MIVDCYQLLLSSAIGKTILKRNGRDKRRPWLCPCDPDGRSLVTSERHMLTLVLT